METGVDKDNPDLPTPIIAYTTGLDIKYTLPSGEVVDATFYCGLRDAAVHPSLWAEKFPEIQDYIYYTFDPAP